MKNPDLIEIKVASEEYKCQFCHRSEINEVEYGPLYRLKDVTVHYFCMLFSSALVQRGKDKEGIMGFFLEDLKKEINRGKKLKCKYCRKNCATIGCLVKKCRFSFHFPCGLENGTGHKFNTNFSSYCPAHKSQVEVPQTVQWKCVICYENVDKDINKIVWTSLCCKRSVFHRLCVQTYASASGYYCKCPNCNSHKKFIKSIQDQCVFVPEREATWEIESGAYSDLYETYKNCDAGSCICPKGRKYDATDDERWTIVRCKGCGASGTHFRCSNLKIPNWACLECSKIINKDNKNGAETNKVSNPQRYWQRRLESDVQNPSSFISCTSQIIDLSSDDEVEMFNFNKRRKLMKSEDIDDVKILYPSVSSSISAAAGKSVNFRKKFENGSFEKFYKMATDHNAQVQIQDEKTLTSLSVEDDDDIVCLNDGSDYTIAEDVSTPYQVLR